MSQSEFAQQLGTSKLTVSQWETGYRKLSSLANRATIMLKELRGKDKTSKMVKKIKIKKRFDKLNTTYFNSELEGSYQI